MLDAIGLKQQALQLTSELFQVFPKDRQILIRVSSAKTPQVDEARDNTIVKQDVVQ